MSNFHREDRYLVIKYSDLERLSYTERRVFGAQCRALHERMFKAGAPARMYLVIESDWPEYEPAWAMIEARVNGTAQPQAVDGLPERTTDTQSCSEVMKRVGLYGAVNVWHGGQIWNAAIDACAPVLAARDAEIERLRRAEDGQRDRVGRAHKVIDTLRADKAEMLDLLDRVKGYSELANLYLDIDLIRAKHGRQS